ncbi:MAG: hypothetical protein AAFR16_03730 [Pseudomonadota bacterium]
MPGNVTEEGASAGDAAGKDGAEAATPLGGAGARRARPSAGAAVLEFPQARPAPPREDAARLAALSARDVARLEALRRLAVESRATPRRDLACELRACACRGGCARDAAVAFFRTAGETTRRLTLRPPGAAQPSEDEVWLLRLIDSIERDDADQAAALVAFRARPAARRALAAMARALTAVIDQLAYLSTDAK